MKRRLGSRSELVPITVGDKRANFSEILDRIVKGTKVE